jgi:signal transduction histidine kinase
MDDVQDSSMVGHVLLDAKMQVAWVNHALERYFGMRREDLIGQDWQQLIQDRVGNIFVDPAVYAAKVSATCDDNTYAEHFECHVHPEGEREERWLEHQSQPITSGPYAGGRVEHYYEISACKRAEQALRVSESRSRALLDGSPVCNKIIDLNSKLQYMSAAGIEQLKIDDITPYYGCVFPSDFYPAWIRAPLIAHLNRALAGDRCSVECPVHDSEGAEVWFDATFTPVLDDAGKVEYVIVTSVNVTERKQAEERTRRTQRELLEHQRRETELAENKLADLKEQLVRQTRLAAIGQLTSSVAGKIRRPLGVMGNALTELKNHCSEDDESASMYLHVISEEIAKADAVIRDMLEMARSKDPVMGIFDMSQMVRDVFEQNHPTAPLYCHLKCNPQPFMIDGDRDQLSQVISNLVTNAVQSLDGSGEVIVELQKSDEHVLIDIQDDGPGIDVAHRDKIFEPLFTTKAKGTGLGLSICRQIIERHGGTIQLQDHDDSGTAFRIMLPGEMAFEWQGKRR